MNINWNAVSYSIPKAKQDFESLVVKDKMITPINPSPEWLPLREELIRARDEIFEKNGLDVASTLGYEFDVDYGFKLYEILNDQIGFTNRAASSNDVWRYLSLRVIPDIVHARIGFEEKQDHYYALPRRVWLSTIWWYIHLSWAGSEEATRELLATNSTDTIMNLVERPGRGYYVDVYREIMKQYKGHTSRDLFRRVLKLNTARLITTSPELVAGGIEQYVHDLFESAGAGK
ncbi:hypothetical protein [Limosilactobacillus ingluviei]|uniref:Uncharacterized protein n=1 Tax=Limosilactobacillus ingluviei DSM 15946 TaxID=1423760 RepID=A0A0R1URR2_9LACO|nr:hypothetical protein [Limosilactobacillus ingluviei]KRL92587.1 hypothetical protein FC43_GL001687 [Limosilactobacillus ingluviei DSM 15946]